MRRKRRTDSRLRNVAQQKIRQGRRQPRGSWKKIDDGQRQRQRQAQEDEAGAEDAPVPHQLRAQPQAATQALEDSPVVASIALLQQVDELAAASDVGCVEDEAGA